MWFIGVEVEQETSAPPPKKNPGSAPELFEGRLALTLGKILTPVFFFFWSKAFFRIILSILFRASNHQIVDKKNKTHWICFLSFHIWVEILH